MSIPTREAVAEQSAPKFEDAMKELEAIVSRLEKDDPPLDDSLAAFQRGVELARLCGQQLDEAERRVELLTVDEAGRPSLRPLETDEHALRHSSSNSK
jgi:exodeoxyribonuclease VII small subunit